MAEALVVLKCGSSVLRTPEDLPAVVHAVYAHVRRGARVVVVVSAIGDTTDDLLARARALGAGNEHAVAALLATGEAQSAALLTLALARAGVPAHIVDAGAIGLHTRGPALDAEPCALAVAAVRARLAERPVLVVPGFVGVGAGGASTLLGRGGSDLTAVYLAAELGADACVLCKDVDGLYEGDPARSSGARRFVAATYDDALAVGGRLVQARAIALARARGVAITVAALHGEAGTHVGAASSRAVAASSTPPPLRVGLLGLGTVGSGVFDRLRAMPERFAVQGVAVRDPRRPRAHAPRGLLRSTAHVLASRCDVLVDVTGDVHLGADLAGALARGVHVVSANKAVVAKSLPDLRRAAARGGASLSFSGAVGGAVPALATAARLRRRGVVRVEGILNTTTNWVLAALTRGADFESALTRAQELGFAEADPGRDLDGRDAADKLVLLADAAFAVELSAADIRRVDVRDVPVAWCREVAATGGALRLVACLQRSAAGAVAASVAPRVLSPGATLFALGDADNAVEFTLADGSTGMVHGAGAGRWPTTEAVLGDLLELSRRLARACDQRTVVTDLEVAS